MNRITLNPVVHQQIVASIRAGAYPHVAAQAWGIDPKVFDDWVQRGSKPRARKPYATFAAEVKQAHAQARLMAERGVWEKQPKAWLQNGPGREQADSPGWTSMVKPPPLPKREAKNAWLDREFIDVMRSVLDALAPFPEARLHVARTLAPWTDAPPG